MRVREVFRELGFKGTAGSWPNSEAKEGLRKLSGIFLTWEEFAETEHKRQQDVPIIFKFLPIITILCVRTTNSCAMLPVWRRSEDNFVKSVPSLHFYMVPEIRLSLLDSHGKCL